MTDFTKCLYTHYIKPQLQNVPPGEYTMYISLAQNQTPPHARQEYEKTAEYIAIRSFLLGFRTGAGLSPFLND